MAQIIKKTLETLSHLKVAIYIRVSTHWQIDKDSLQVQKRELIAYAQMVLGITDYEIFEDPGYSAKNTDRPDYQRMMGRLRSGEFSHILVWKIDRISRNLLDFAGMYNELKELGVTFVSKNEQFDTSSAIGEAMLKIILVFAELERNMTSERVTAVMLSRANNGQWNGGRVAYGYDYDKVDKVFTPNPQEAAIVRRIFNMYEEEQSVLYVARCLNEKCVKTRSGKAWSATGVHKILTNKFYIGTYVYNVHNDGRAIKQRAEDEWIQIPFHHEAIIAAEQFDRVQLSLKRNKRGGIERGERHTSKHIHTFAGLIKCGVCDANMSATLDRRRANGWRPSIYACSRRRHESTACDNKYVSDATIGPFIINYVANIIRAKETIGKSTTIDMLERRLLKGDAFSSVASIEREGIVDLYNLLKSGSTGLEYKPKSVFAEDGSGNEIEYLQEQRRKTEIALNRMKSLYLFDESGISKSEYIKERQKLIDQIEDLEKRISALQTPDNNETYSEEFEAKASYFVMVERLLSGQHIDYVKYIKGIDPKVPRNFFHQIINKIYVTDGRVSSIEFANGMTHKFSYK